MLHGFTNTSATWGDFLTLVSQAYGVRTLDLPGHGTSSAVRADLVTSGSLVAKHLCDPSILLGYSLGGRVALHCALEQPTALRGLILIGSTPGIRDDGERALRRSRDETLAAELRQRADLKGFLEQWLSGPLFTHLTSEQQHLEGRLENTVEGLASSLELAGLGTQEPLWGRLGDITVPTLVLAGSEDEKFTNLGKAMAVALPYGRFAAVSGAGHAVHLERPREVAELVLDFIARVSPQAVSGPDEETS